MAFPTIDAAVCERLVTTALGRCTGPPATVLPPSIQAVPAAVQPNFDGLAASFGALSVALTVGTIVIGILGLAAAFAWGHSVRNMAEREARKEAEKCAKQTVDAYMSKWLATEAPQIVRRHVENLVNASLGSDDDEEAAEKIGKEAG